MHSFGRAFVGGGASRPQALVPAGHSGSVSIPNSVTWDYVPGLREQLYPLRGPSVPARSLTALSALFFFPSTSLRGNIDAQLSKYFKNRLKIE